jgi:hypothetical protein
MRYTALAPERFREFSRLMAEAIETRTAAKIAAQSQTVLTTSLSSRSSTFEKREHRIARESRRDILAPAELVYLLNGAFVWQPVSLKRFNGPVVRHRLIARRAKPYHIAGHGGFHSGPRGLSAVALVAAAPAAAGACRLGMWLPDSVRSFDAYYRRTWRYS